MLLVRFGIIRKLMIRNYNFNNKLLEFIGFISF